MATTKVRIGDPHDAGSFVAGRARESRPARCASSRLASYSGGAGILLYLGIWAWTGSFTINDTDFDVFFLPSARIALAGHPLHIYQVLFQGNYPNANGPLSILPLTIVAWVAQHLGWLDWHEARRALVMGAFAVFPLLLAREALLALDRLLSAPLVGAWRLLAYAILIFSPELWHSVLLYGHIEQPMMIWLTLWSVRALVERRFVFAGVADRAGAAHAHHRDPLPGAVGTDAGAAGALAAISGVSRGGGGHRTGRAGAISAGRRQGRGLFAG